MAEPDSGLRPPARVWFSRFAGQPLPASTRLITRPGRYGNPYKAVAVGGQEAAAALFRAFITARRYPPPGWTDPFPRYPSDGQIRADLSGSDLACACQPGTPCHGDTLLLVANGGTL